MAAGPVEPAPFTAGEGLTIRGEVAGEGPAIVLCHGITATRRYVVHGSRTLERAGYTVVAYDARAHGESDPAPPGGSYGYSDLVADLESVVEETVGDATFVLGGHSMGAHTAVAYALRHPERLAGLVVIGPAYNADVRAEVYEFWDGLAAALELGGVDGFVDYIDREQGIDPAWRDTVLWFTRERMLRHRDLDALAEAVRQIPRSDPFESTRELESIDVPALVVASRDQADPGHPYEVATAYAQRLPQARLISEEPGQSPLAWRGGKLSREIAAFCAEPAVAERLTS